MQDFDSDVINLSEEDVRKAEKELIAYNSESFAVNLSPIFYGFEVLFRFWCLASVFYSLSHPEDIALVTRAQGTTNRSRDSGAS